MSKIWAWFTGLFRKVVKRQFPDAPKVSEFWPGVAGWKLKAIWESGGVLWWSIYNNKSRNDSKLYANGKVKVVVDNETVGGPLLMPDGWTYLAHEGSDEGVRVKGSTADDLPKLSNKLSGAVVNIDGKPCQWRSNQNQKGQKLVNMLDGKTQREVDLDGFCTGAYGDWLTLAMGDDAGINNVKTGFRMGGQAEALLYTSSGLFALLGNRVMKLSSTGASEHAKLPCKEAQSLVLWDGWLAVGGADASNDYVYLVDLNNKDRVWQAVSWKQDQSLKSLFDVVLGVADGKLYAGRATGGNNDAGKIYLLDFK